MYTSVHTFKTYIMIALILAVARASLKQPDVYRSTQKRKTIKIYALYFYKHNYKYACLKQYKMNANYYLKLNANKLIR